MTAGASTYGVPQRSLSRSAVLARKTEIRVQGCRSVVLAPGAALADKKTSANEGRECQFHVALYLSPPRLCSSELVDKLAPTPLSIREPQNIDPERVEFDHFMMRIDDDVAGRRLKGRQRMGARFV